MKRTRLIATTAALTVTCTVLAIPVYTPFLAVDFLHVPIEVLLRRRTALDVFFRPVRRRITSGIRATVPCTLKTGLPPPDDIDDRRTKEPKD